MSLTKSDLSEIEKIIKPLAQDIKGVETDIKSVKNNLTEINKELSDVRRRIKKIEIDVDAMSRVFDAEDVRLTKRVEVIEDRLGIQPEN